MTRWANFPRPRSANLASLPATPPTRRADRRRRKALQASIAAKAAPSGVAAQAKSLAAGLLAAYPVPLAPAGASRSRPRRRALCARIAPRATAPKARARAPQLARDGPAADRLRRPRPRPRPQPVRALPGDQPRPRRHGDAELRPSLRGRSLGAGLPQPARLAYARRRAAGERCWPTTRKCAPQIPDLAALVAMTPAELEARIGADKAAAVIAYPPLQPGRARRRGSPTRCNSPATAFARASPPMPRGDRAEAKRLALSAYLDGFEPVEAVLATRDGGLMARGRAGDGRLPHRDRARRARGRAAPAARPRTEALLDRAEAALAPEAESGDRRPSSAPSPSCFAKGSRRCWW